jgi:catechol 2,3-dioxygenase-like lactoylglutathione lyase family enzyme
MKHFHVHFAVRDFDASIGFYSRLFGRAPSKRREDYAKWQLDDPQLNFAISPAASAPGLDHVGFEYDSRESLSKAVDAWQVDRLEVAEPSAATCCYANSEKAWLHDPQGTAWEAFVTHSESDSYGPDVLANSAGAAACCGPRSGGTSPR